MTILSSTGFTSSKLLNFCLKELALQKDEIKCGIVTTASEIEKEQNQWAIFTKKYLNENDIEKVDFIDIEYDDCKKLNQYEIIIINGGNPYYLLNQVKLKNIEELLIRLCNSSKVVIGISAGAFILSQSIMYVDQYNKIMKSTRNDNGVQLTDFSALNIYKGQIIPHFDILEKKYPELTDFLKSIEDKTQSKILRIKNNEDYYIDNDKCILI